MGWLACLLGFHRYVVVLDTGAWHLAHLHPLAGCLAACARCGCLWCDARVGAPAPGAREPRRG